VEQERLLFIQEALNPHTRQAFGEVCEKFGISRKTGYKWLDRYHLFGHSGLKDMSRARLTHANKLPSDVIEEVIKVRKEFPSWGPKKIRAEICRDHELLIIPSESSIGKILKDFELSKPRHYRRHVARTSPLSECVKPNDIWMYDFKGYFKTGNGQICEPLTITDGYSRYLLKCVHMKRKRAKDVWEVLEEAFYEYGLPTKIRSDNGPPFATVGLGRLSSLAIKLIKAGVTPEWITPGCPQENGRHERFHLTLKNETALPAAETLSLQIMKMKQFETYYNARRPHEALKQKTPKEIYQPSNRRWDGKLRNPEYDQEYEVRKVGRSGNITWKGTTYFLSESLQREYVGIKEVEVGVMNVNYGPILLGKIDLRKGFKRI
jgi:putative transposase